MIREKEKGSGRWWIFVNHKGKRTSKKIGSRKAAKEAAAKIEKEIALERFNLENPEKTRSVLFRDYAEKWMSGHVNLNLKISTYLGYRNLLENHIYPTFGIVPLPEISREEIKNLCYEKLKGGLSARTVSYVARTLSSVFNYAIEEGILSTNPAARPGRYIKVGDQRESIDFLTPDEGRLLLNTAKEHLPRFYTLILLALRTGLRQGEIIGLQWGDIDFAGRFIEVKRSCWKKIVTSPKSGKSRRVDMSDQLGADLLDHRRRLAAEALRKGQPMADWVFPSTAGTPLEPNRVRETLRLALKKAGLRRIRFHDLRHSFASWLISNGESLVYVRDQMGHHSIQITVDTYGHLIPGSNRKAVNALDDPSWRDNSVKFAPQAHPEGSQEIQNPHNCLKKLARPEGFEPPAA